jgi:hypothetical protein
LGTFQGEDSGIQHKHHQAVLNSLKKDANEVLVFGGYDCAGVFQTLTIPPEKVLERKSWIDSWLS